MSDDMFPGAAPDAFPGQAEPNSGGGVSPVVAGIITLISNTPNLVVLSASDATGGTGPYTYQWWRQRLDGGGLPVNTFLFGQTALLLTNPGLVAGATYLYSLVYTDSLGATNTATLMVTTPLTIGIRVHPDYILSYIEPKQFFQGEARPLKWTISRTDGANVDLPTAGSILVTDTLSGTLLATLVPDVESSLPVPIQTVAAEYAFALVGILEVELSLTIGTQTIQDEQMLQCRA